MRSMLAVYPRLRRLCQWIVCAIALLSSQPASAVVTIGFNDLTEGVVFATVFGDNTAINNCVGIIERLGAVCSVFLPGYLVPQAGLISASFYLLEPAISDGVPGDISDQLFFTELCT